MKYDLHNELVRMLRGNCPVCGRPNTQTKISLEVNEKTFQPVIRLRCDDAKGCAKFKGENGIDHGGFI